MGGKTYFCKNGHQLERVKLMTRKVTDNFYLEELTDIQCPYCGVKELSYESDWGEDKDPIVPFTPISQEGFLEEIEEPIYNEFGEPVPLKLFKRKVINVYNVKELFEGNSYGTTRKNS